MYWVYILESRKNGSYYVGQTNNLQDRLRRHNLGKSQSTKFGVPWKCVCNRRCETRAEAMRLERWIKSMKSARFIEQLIQGEIVIPEEIAP